MEFEGGSRQTLRLNGGGVLAVGAAFWPLQDGRFETRATVGLKYEGDAWALFPHDSAAYGLVPYSLFEEIR